MLQIIFSLLVILFSGDAFAQYYQQQQPANVPPPAFLQDEASHGQYQQQLYQQQQYMNPVQDGSVPEFLRKEQEQEQQQYQLQMIQLQQQQNQYNYQSADPNAVPATATIVPPAVYQPAPGDTPAFLIQPQDPQQQGQVETLSPPPQNEQTFKASQKEDVIQINFSDDQYKDEEEVTQMNRDEATQYNTAIKKNTEENSNTAEIPEGAKFEGEVRPEGQPAETVTEKGSEIMAEKEKQIETAAVPEPQKSKQNMMRITYSQEVTELSEKDKASLLAVVRLLRGNKSQKILITSNTSERDLGISADKIALMRVIGIRDFLMKQKVDFSQTEVKVISGNRNKDDLDYIDIDKI